MRITTQQKKLKYALSIVEKVASRNISLPILSNIVLKTEGGLLKIIATNLEVGITFSIGVKIEETGEIAVPARIFTDFISNISDDNISLKTKNNTLYIDSENYKTQILGFSTKEFPIIPKIKTTGSFIIPAKDLKESLYCTMDSMALSEARPEISGLFMSIEQNKAVFASTDSFRLSEYKIEGLNNKNISQKSVIIPRNTVTEVFRMISELANDIEIKIEDKQIAFMSDDCEIISRLIDGNYPEYSKVIPDKFVSKVLVDKKELEKSVRLAGLFTSSISDVKIDVGDKKTTITSKNTDRGEIQASLDSILKNDPFSIAINFSYLLDGIKVIKTDKVIMEFTGTNSPLVIKPSDEKHKLTYIIMPLRG